MATGLKLPNGMDLDDIFVPVSSGNQTLNILTNVSQDIGQRYAAGRARIEDTGFRAPDGIDIRNKLSGFGVGMFRPNCISWNGYRGGYDDQEHVDYWENWLELWISQRKDATQVDGVMNDCVWRDIHSDYHYSSVLFAYNPYRDAGITFTCNRIYHANYHNSWNIVNYHLIEIDAYCKGVVFCPTSGAGGGTQDIFSVSASVGGRGTLYYEGLYAIDNDSNKPVVGTSNKSGTVNGKYYSFYNG